MSEFNDQVLTKLENIEKVVRKSNPKTSLFSILEKLIIPSTIVFLALFAHLMANKLSTDQIALDKRIEKRQSTESQQRLELKYTEIFFDKLLSNDERTSKSALSLLQLMSEENGFQLANWVQKSELFTKDIRDVAKEVGESISGFREIIIDPAYEHDKFQTQPKDITRQFASYIVSFDSDDDDDGDGQSDLWGIPHFVSCQINRDTRKNKIHYIRPGRWMSDGKLVRLRIAPTDKPYRGSGYDRGHLAASFLAARISPEAAWNTNTVLNAIPQQRKLNRGIWLSLERKTGEWADKYGVIWVIAGPVFTQKKPSSWIGNSSDSVKVAVPEAVFKIIIRKDSEDFSNIKTLAFIYPQNGWDNVNKPYNHNNYLTSIDKIEELTDLDFLTILPDSVEGAIESSTASGLWK